MQICSMHSHVQRGNEMAVHPVRPTSLILIRYNLHYYYIGDNSVTIYLPKPKKNPIQTRT